jgi:hypothetical protein
MPLSEEQAAVKIEAVARGNKDRARVQKMKEDKAKETSKTSGETEDGKNKSEDKAKETSKTSGETEDGKVKSLTEEQAAIKIEAVARGNKDRARVQKMKEDKAKETSKTSGETEDGKVKSLTEEQAAIKIEAVARGNKDRAKVKKIKTEKEKQKQKEKKKQEKKSREKSTMKNKPKRPKVENCIVNSGNPSPRKRKNEAAMREKALADKLLKEERIEREMKELSDRFLEEITVGVIEVPSKHYPDINSAVRRAKDSNGGIKTIHLAEGEYHLTDKHHAGFNYCVLDFPIHIIGENASHTTIVGMFELQPNGKAKADKKGSLVYEGPGIVLTELSITNPTDKHVNLNEQPTTRGIWSDRGLPLTLNHCDIYGCKGDGLYVRGGSYVRLNRCKVHENKCQGIFLSGAGTLGLAVDLELNNNGDSGLYVNRGADIDLRGFRLSIYHNGMYKKNRFGIKASGTDSEIRIHLPQEHEFLVDNGLHVESEDKDGEWERTTEAKNKSEEFGGIIKYMKLTKKQLASYANYVRRMAEDRPF